MSNASTTRRPRKSAAEKQAEAEAKALAEQQAAEQAEREAVQAAYNRFEQFTSVQRVRVHFEDRKMSVPGRIHMTQDQRPILTTNWGLELDLSKEPVTVIEVKNLDSGKFESVQL